LETSSSLSSNAKYSCLADVFDETIDLEIKPLAAFVWNEIGESYRLYISK